MVRFPDNPPGSLFWRATPALLALAALAAFLTVSAGRITWRAWEISRERARLAAEVAAREAERQRLEASVRASEAPEVVERLAKERLNLRNPGEEVALISPPGSPPAMSAPSATLRAWLGWLVGLFWPGR